MKNKVVKKVFILGVQGFPTGTARIEKLKLFGKSILSEAIEVQFLCNSWSMYPKGMLPVKGIIEGIKYYYTCGVTYRPVSFVHRRFVKFKGYCNEIFYLFTNKCDAVIVSVVSGDFFSLFKYWLISRIIGYKIYFPYHEDENSQIGDKGLLAKLNLYLFKKYAFNIIDGAFPITTYLENIIKSRNKYLPMLRIPALVNFDFFTKKRVIEISYFLYCGSLGYFDVINFIIESFEKLDDIGSELHLVCNGTQSQMNILNNRIDKSPKKELIKHYSFLSYEELVEKYINAEALLIPLRNSTQDIARFPHKIGEYSASGRPIITNSIGDIELYFTNKENALIASKMDIEDYTSMMKYVIENTNEANKIGLRGKGIGKNFFDYKSYSKSIISFTGLDKY